MEHENYPIEISDYADGFSACNGMDNFTVDTSLPEIVYITCDCMLGGGAQGIGIPAHLVPEFLDMMNKHLSKYSEANND